MKITVEEMCNTSGILLLLDMRFLLENCKVANLYETTIITVDPGEYEINWKINWWSKDIGGHCTLLLPSGDLVISDPLYLPIDQESYSKLFDLTGDFSLPSLDYEAITIIGPVKFDFEIDLKKVEKE